ncbi:MAG TPA: putative glycolipid-binding domain-containing protein [Pseudonocardiaceae bacterium]|nr:putative glycolipid-binding domain-containing protein [Pseudonocardiaceae bacterium]
MDLPTSSGAVAWRHEGSGRLGLETTYFLRQDDGWLFNGTTEATEDGRDWSVGYQLIVDSAWRTRRARVMSDDLSILLEGDGGGHWVVDGGPAPALDGCLDVDLEASALTNAFPVHRLGLAVGASADAPAVYVRVAGLAVARLAQRYTRIEDDELGERYDYVAPEFDVHTVVAYDRTGFVRTYPDIAVRV